MDKTGTKYLKICLFLAALAAFAWTAQSAWRWAHFNYTTFDLAFYVQALDGFLHGRNWSSLLGVQPFGNHADFIILLILPLYAVIQHPLTLVMAQNLALAACLPLGWKIARNMGWSPQPAFWLALVLLVNPVLTFVAIHEFHPEAFAAPLWLAIYYSWQHKNLRLFWLSLILFLSCKENVGLIAGTWFFTKLFDRPNRQVLWQWILLPGIFTTAWMAIYLFWLGPSWNAGNVDFGALYSHLSEKGFLHGATENFSSSLRGNLLWALLLPMLFIPLRKPLSLLPALPILLQHLLSWRSSEWTVYYHYAAPLLPVFWIATLESIMPVHLEKKKWYLTTPFFLLVANMLCFFVVETPRQFVLPFFTKDEQLLDKKEIIARIPKYSSVLAPLPFQAHLAARPEIYSLHLVLKGLKTLSRKVYAPPAPTDYVIVDYNDPITFDSSSGYYHPAMKLKTGEIVPSSDVLLHQFLARASWQVEAIGALSFWNKSAQAPVNKTASLAPLKSGVIDPGTDLVSISAADIDSQIQVTSEWTYHAERKKIPWMFLVATRPSTGEKRVFTRGLCCPEGRVDGTIWSDTWKLPVDSPITSKDWELRAIFIDNATRSYTKREPKPEEMFITNISWNN